MGNKVKIAIVGYGNVGKGTEHAIMQNNDMKLEAIFTRRNPESLVTEGSAPRILHVSEAKEYSDIIDVAVLCGGSATDLPTQGPEFAGIFNIVDSFDTHARIPEYFNSIDKASRKAGRIGIISTGWDPGLFSIMRLIEEAVLPMGSEYTFWGPGVSQGHSDAVRRLEGVRDARQYTIPIDSALRRVRSGENPKLTTKEKHLRHCYVVPEENVDLEEIADKIKTMPYYFSDYETKVEFISEDEMLKEHSEMPHGGFVLRTGTTGNNSKQLIEFSLKLDSNPEFTGTILVAYARAAFRLNKEEGQTGARNVFDIAPKYLSIRSQEELTRELL